MKFSDDPVGGFSQAGGILAGLAAFAIGVRKLAQAIRLRPLFKNGEAEAIMRKLADHQRSMEEHCENLARIEREHKEATLRIETRLDNLAEDYLGVARRIKRIEVAHDSETP